MAEPPLRRKVLVWVAHRGPDGPRVLLLQRAPPWPREWHPVTGHAGEGETVEAAALRETREETACEGRLLDLAYSHRFRGTWEGTEYLYEEHAFALEAPSDACVLSREHAAFRWATFEDAASEVRFEEQREALRRARAALGA